jgi:hypothetical protein
LTNGHLAHVRMTLDDALGVDMDFKLYYFAVEQSQVSATHSQPLHNTAKYSTVEVSFAITVITAMGS